VAGELVEDRLEQGARSGYLFIFAEQAGELVGYVAWGAIPMTRASYDLYWIMVDPVRQGGGLGRELMRRTEDAVSARGGGGLYIETSSLGRYSRTRRFYRHAGYRRAARLRDFYAPGDHKIVFCKTLIQKP
jgi:GNAT superfamily N-acetyltransferase